MNYEAGLNAKWIYRSKFQLLSAVSKTCSKSQVSPDLHGSRQHTCPVGQGSFGEHDWRSVPSHSGLGNCRNGRINERRPDIAQIYDVTFLYLCLLHVYVHDLLNVGNTSGRPGFCRYHNSIFHHPHTRHLKCTSQKLLVVCCRKSLVVLLEWYQYDNYKIWVLLEWVAKVCRQ